MMNNTGGVYMKKVKGFTLAEVLITLSIIGIVAAITIPMVITKYQKIVSVNKLKKMYNQIQQVFEMAKADNFDYVSLFNTDEYVDFIEKEIYPKFNGAKYFYSSNAYHAISLCNAPRANSYSWRKNVKQNVTSGGFPSQASPSIKTNDGACIVFWSNEPKITVDVDGFNKGKNTFGDDTFMFEFDTNNGKLVPHGFKQSKSNIMNNCPDIPGSSAGGHYCATRIILYDNWQIKYQ